MLLTGRTVDEGQGMTPKADIDSSNEHEEVTPLELLFDLVFAFAVSQLSHHLSAHLSWQSAAETVVMLLAVLAVWSYTSWAATMVSADQSKTRWMMLAVMLLGLFMNAAIPGAFKASAWEFVIPLLLIQLGRTVWTIVTAPDAMYREHFFRVLGWLVATTPLWIVGASTDPSTRLAWWGLAAGIDLVGTWLAHPVPGRRLHSERIVFNASHMLERCRLFLLIALGETVLTTGTAIADAPMSLLTMITGCFALAGTVALWSLTFGRSIYLTARHLEVTSDPVRISRHAVNAVMVMVAGLIAVAVANEEVISHPRADASAGLSLLLAGGPLLFLVAQGWFLCAVPNVRSHFHAISVATLVLVGLVTLVVPPYAALIVAGAVLSTLAIFEPDPNEDVASNESTEHTNHHHR
jgi:low temperature requirement protein LtrA